MAVKKWWWRRSMQATLGCGEKRRRMGTDAVEDDKAGATLTRAREAVKQLGDDGKAVAVEELGGGGARARRGEEESGDGCSEGQARAMAFYKGRREVEAPGT
jgi:ribosomal protein L19E